jgi:hypothetical protein
VQSLVAEAAVKFLKPEKPETRPRLKFPECDNQFQR